MAGLMGRILRGAGRRVAAAMAAGPPPTEFLRARARFGAALPDGPLAAQRYVVFDLEATGLSPSRGDAIVAIGAVRIRDAAVAEGETFQTLVDPGRPIPAAAARYHGITDAMVRGVAPGAAEALARFRDFAGGDVLVAHNAGFDRTLLHMAELRDGAPALPNPVLCSMALSRWLDPEEQDHSLDGLCARAGIVIGGRHTALGDARATAEAWLRLLARAAARGVEHLPELVRRTRMEAAVDGAAAHF